MERPRAEIQTAPQKIKPQKIDSKKTGPEKTASKKVELLSPAGNFQKLKIALAYGADAVYGGVSHFSLRNRAGKEFTYESFHAAVRYTHQMGKKIYATINGFPFNAQLKLLAAHIEKMRDLGVDAFIVATPGVIRLCQKIAPAVPLHLSTQANVLNLLDAEAFFELGVRRIVAARELSLKDAIAIKNHLPSLEIEIFCHGSMCFAFSGRCLISSLQNGRVPNRGSCANDCRFDYEYFVRNPENGVMMRLEEEGAGTHIFNAKDLNLSQHIDEILESGAINALKIEGRTKSEYYAGVATRTYRRAIDDFYLGRQDKGAYARELDTLQNRGYTDGYLVHRPFERLDTQNHKEALSEGEWRVNALVREDGEWALCKHTIRVGEAKEIVLPLGVDFARFLQEIGGESCCESNVESFATPAESSRESCIESSRESRAAIELFANDIGRIFMEGDRFFVVFYKIILEDGRNLGEIHSGNVHCFKMPTRFPAFSFLRQRIHQRN